MSVIDDALSANATIANDYDPERGKPPAPKIAIVTCADPRLSDIEQMLKARSHPWISPDVPVRGFVYDVHTGRLSEVFPDEGAAKGQ
jgi:carbonic anhydrase